MLVWRPFRNEHERECSRALIGLFPEIVPPTIFLSRFGILSRRLRVLTPDIFSDLGLSKLWEGLEGSIYSRRSSHFSTGLYRQFSFSLCVRGEYWDHVIDCVEALKLIFPNVDFSTAMRALGDTGQFTEREFYWLHGDLHVGNIVTWMDGHFIIDYEYMRYGIREMDLASLLWSLQQWSLQRFRGEFAISRTEIFSLADRWGICPEKLRICGILIECLHAAQTAARTTSS